MHGKASAVIAELARGHFFEQVFINSARKTLLATRFSREKVPVTLLLHTRIMRRECQGKNFSAGATIQAGDFFDVAAHLPVDQHSSGQLRADRFERHADRFHTPTPHKACDHTPAKRHTDGHPRLKSVGQRRRDGIRESLRHMNGSDENNDVRDELAVAHAHFLKIISARLVLHFHTRNIESKLNGLIGHHSSLPRY